MSESSLPASTWSVVGLFGFAGQTANNNGASFGLNVIAANCARVDCPYGSGFSTGTIVGAEIDLNQRKTGTTTPPGQAVGLFVTGDSESIPANGAYAVDVKHFGIGLNVPWSVGFQTDDGAAQTGAMIGALNTTGLSDSQFLTWKGFSGSPVVPIFMAAQLLQDHFLEFFDDPNRGTGGMRSSIQICCATSHIAARPIDWPIGAAHVAGVGEVPRGVPTTGVSTVRRRGPT